MDIKTHEHQLLLNNLQVEEKIAIHITDIYAVAVVKGKEIRTWPCIFHHLCQQLVLYSIDETVTFIAQ